MRIQSQLKPQTPARSLKIRQPLSHDGGKPSGPQETHTWSPAARTALVGGIAATAGAGLALVRGIPLGQTLGLVGSLAVIGVVGASLWNSAEPPVPLTPELDSLLVGRFHNDQKQSIQKALNALGPDNVARLQQGGVRMLVDAERVPVKAAACYYATDRVVAFRRSEVDKGTVIHELGHALDNLDLPPSAAAEARFRSQVDPQVLDNYQSYLDRMDSDQSLRSVRWSDYAKTNEREYLAEGVTWYLENPEKKAELLKKDPQHYAYVERFLNRP